MRTRLRYLAVFAIWIIPLPVQAQEVTERADSLEREIRILKARLDSLQHVLERLVRAGEDTTEVVDELAALRAAARAIVPEQPADTAPEQHVIRSRSLNRLNPEISVTGDVRLQGKRPGPQENNVDLREFSFGFQSALDPYSNTKIFFSFGEGQVDIEEAYAYWTGLPGGLRLDVGRFRLQAGELNRWHLHALPESEYPPVLTEYFGGDGLASEGISLYWLAPVTPVGGGVHEAWGQVTLANNAVLFGGGSRLSLLGHLNNFWQLNPSTYFQIGGTALYGENPDAELTTSAFGTDLRITWRPPVRALYRSFTLRGEGFGVRRKIGGIGTMRYGGYVSADYQTSRRIHLGGRFDYVELLDSDEHIWAVVPQLTWWQSEWVFLRAEWRHLSEPATMIGRDTSDLFVIQIVWSIGPHKHESY